jgi:hypothetical protein
MRSTVGRHADPSVGLANAPARRIDGDNRPGRQRGATAGEAPLAPRRLIRHGLLNEPRDAGVGETGPHGELAEVPVERHQNAAVAVGHGQDRSVARIARPIGHHLDVMPSGAQCGGRARPDRRIERQPHEARPSGGAIGMRRSEPLVHHGAVSIGDAGQNILARQPGTPIQQRIGRITHGEVDAHMLDREAPTANDRLPTIGVRVVGDPF